MSYSVAQIRAWHPSTVPGGASEASTAVQGLDNAVSLLNRGKQNLLSEWKSRSAAPAAEAKYSRTIADADNRGQVLLSMIREISTGGHALIDARDQVLQTVAKARSAGFDVDEQTGKVTPKHIAHATGPGFTGMQAAQHNVDQELAAAGFEVAIEAACAKFEAADDQIAGALGDSPDATSAQQKAIIAAVDAGQLPNALAALQIPYTAYTKKGQETIVRWAHDPAGSQQIGTWIAHEKKISLPPNPIGYEFEMPRVGLSDFLSVACKIIVPGSVGVGSLVFAKNGIHPTLSADLADGTNGTLSPSVDDTGGSVSASVELRGQNGSTQMGTDQAPDGAPETWVKTTHPIDIGGRRAKFETTLDVQPGYWKPQKPQTMTATQTVELVTGVAAGTAALATGVPEIVLIAGGLQAAGAS